MALLEIENLQKVFYTPEHDVSAVVYVPELQLEQGEALVLDGPSGSGKTTVLHMISGLLSPDSGSVYFDGADVCQLPPKARAAWRGANIGYIFQRLNLLEELTVLENILLPLCWQKSGAAGGVWRERALSLLARVGLEGRESSLPGKLSIGEQQRVAVVRALLLRPRLLLADEPTASLDRRSGETVLALLQELCQLYRVSLLLSTHDEAVKERFAKRYDVRSCAYE